MTNADRYLQALADCQPEVDSWVSADAVNRRLDSMQRETNPNVQHARGSSLVVGQALSRLARSGRCERAWWAEGGCWAYRPYR